MELTKIIYHNHTSYGWGSLWYGSRGSAQLSCWDSDFPFFFRPIFVLLVAPPFLVNGTGRYLIKDSQGVEGSNRIEKSRIAQLLRKLDPKNQKTRFFNYLKKYPSYMRVWPLKMIPRRRAFRWSKKKLVPLWKIWKKWELYVSRTQKIDFLKTPPGDQLY